MENNNNNKKDPNALVQGWLDEILSKLDIPEPNTLGADEQAAREAGLIHPDDMELEQIVQETLAENWGEEPAPEEAANEGTQFFTPAVQEEAFPQEESFELNFEDAEETPQEATQEEAQEDFQDKVMRKLRPKAKGGAGLWGIPHIISTVIWLFLIVTIGVSLGRTVWVCAADLLALGKTPMSASVTLTEDDELPEIAEKLKDAGLIKYPNLFEAFAKLTKKGQNTLVGTITFDDKMVYDYNALINTLSYRGSSLVTVEVLIPEGYNCAQIFALLEQKKVCTAKELEEYAASGELEKYWFLDGVERGHKYCLEGFLFPDTYEFYVGDKPGRVLEKFLSNFQHRFTDDLVDKFVALNNRTGLNLNIRQLVTMASIVEKEKASDMEGYTIASVFYNRLTNPASFPCLQSDATLLYDVNFYSKGQLNTDAQKKKSPYNTYTVKGLPAGPIANPGLSSLDAALDPEDTKYFFFIFDKDAGVSRFSKTLAEHSAWAKKLGLG